MNDNNQTPQVPFGERTSVENYGPTDYQRDMLRAVHSARPEVPIAPVFTLPSVRSFGEFIHSINRGR